MVFRGVGLAAILIAGLLAGCSQTASTPASPSPTTPTTSATKWQQLDIGNVGVPGYTDQQNGGATQVVHGAGIDVWGTSDSFHFSYQKLSGDVTVTAKVASVTQVTDWTKAGVMIRASTKPDAKYVFVLLSPANGTDMTLRSATGATTVEAGYNRAPRPPYWIRVQRVGDTFTGYESPDGTTWTKLGSATVSMPSDVLAGLAVTSKNQSELATAVFDDATARVTSDTSTSPSPPPPAPAPAPAPAPSPNVTTVSYKTDTTDFRNPGRGFYIEAQPGGYDSVYSSGYTMAMRYVRLDNYRNQALPSSFLDSLKTDFAAARGSGVKLVLRFAYNRSMGPDAPINIVLQQIGQLKPILRQYADVIAVLQAGFIGAWGEWHDSTNNLMTLDNRTKIVNALLDAMPSSRMIEIRTPYRINDIYPTPPDASTAFNGSNASRLGQHNDCFVSTSTDGGTFTSNADRSYAQQVTKYTAMGGESCDLGGLSSINDCSNSIQQLEAYHWDYLNASYWSSILDKWKSQGCYSEISKRLGYRYTLTQLTGPTNVVPATTIDMKLDMTNSGFGKLYNPRPMQLVFVPTSGGTPVTLTVNDDARTLMPAPGASNTIDASVMLPSGTPSGTYDVYLNLPDGSSTLNTDPKYSIRLADQGTWDPNSGYNNLNFQVTVE